MIFFSSDPHFGREAILSCASRPFSNIGEMNWTILSGYRSMVSDEDDLYIVGDFAHKNTSRDEAAYWFDQIPGRKHLIRGNHDKGGVLSLPWASVNDILEVEDCGVTFVLCHYPMASWNNARLGARHLFGHIHDKFPGSRRAINVGVDHWDWAPCESREILRRMRGLGEHPGWDAIEPWATEMAVA